MSHTLLPTTPFLEYKIWGGKLLAQKKDLPVTNPPLGETWEISTHPVGSCMVDGKALKETCSLSYIVKFIDTSDNLSVQVHPDDEYAKEHENDRGKTECWLITDHIPGSGIYLGLKNNISFEHFKSEVEKDAHIADLMNFYPVKKGDFVVVPAGTLHAIGKGVSLVEIQQSSGITYRVWDWGRLGSDGKPRQLHKVQALDVVKTNFECQITNYAKGSSQLLYQHADFQVHFISLKANEIHQLEMKNNSALICLEGDFLAGDLNLKSYQSAFNLHKNCVEIKALTTTQLLYVTEG